MDFSRVNDQPNPMIEQDFHLPETYRLRFDVWLDVWLGTVQDWTHVFTGTYYFAAVVLFIKLTIAQLICTSSVCYLRSIQK